MKIGVDDLARNLPKAIEAGGGESPPWLDKMESIVKGINDMIGFYNQLSGKPAQVNTPGNYTPKLSWSEAREIKKAEMTGRQGELDTTPGKISQAHAQSVHQAASNEFQELLSGLIKASTTLAGMGFKEKTIGQVIQELPFTLGQTKDFLEKLYQSKYGG